MLRIYFFFILGIVPLCAQASFNNDGNKLNPAAPPAVIPEPPTENSTMKPGLGAPPPGTQEPGVPPAPGAIPEHTMPAEPVVLPKITSFTISPGTIREGLTDKNIIRTTVVLSVPTMKGIICHVISADPKKFFCGDILVPKGFQQQNGYVKIDWIQVRHDCKVEIKAYDDENPEALFHARVYLRKKLE